MRLFTTLLLLLSFHAVFSQEGKKDRAFFVEPLFRLHGIVPVDLGTNYLADANKGKLSFGINMSMFEYHNFRLAVGIDRIYYDATDVTRAATIEHTRLNTYYGQLVYEIPITKAFSVQPYLGFGSSEMNFIRASAQQQNYYGIEANSISKQSGNNFRCGFYTDYRIDKIFTVFAGVAYSKNKFNVTTAPEFVSYYQQSRMIQLNFGIKIGYSLKNKYFRDKQTKLEK